MSKLIGLVDEDLPRLIDGILEKLSWKVKDVRDIGLRGKSDEEIISFAKKSRAVLFSADWGFANILKFPPKDYFGIVILSFPNEVSDVFLVREIRRTLMKIPRKDFKGRLIILEPGKIRIRKEWILRNSYEVELHKNLKWDCFALLGMTLRWRGRGTTNEANKANEAKS